MNKPTAENLLSRYDKAHSHAMLFHQLYEDAYTLVVPDRETFTQKSPGQDRAIGVYDSSGMRAGQGFVNRFLSNVCPAYQRWAELSAGDMVDENIQDALNEVMELVTKQLFSAIHASNFNVAVGEFAYDVGVGTGAMLALENDDLSEPFRFITVPPSQIAIEDDAYGKVKAVFRKFDVQGRYLQDFYPDGDYSGMEQEIKSKENDKFCIIECTYHDPKTDKWTYTALFRDKKKIFVERTYFENPWIILRWSKVPGECFGRGPFVQALPDLKTQNKVREMSLYGLQMAVMGIYTGIHQDIMNTQNIILEPGTIIPVDRNGGPNGPTIAPLLPGGNPEISYIEIERLESGIREMMLDNRLPPEAGPVRSATEIVERIQQLQTDVGAAFGRIMVEFINPLIKRLVGIMQRKGLITLPEGLTLDNLFLKVELLSPIARVQRMSDVQSVVNALQIAMGLDPQMSTVPLIYDMEKVQRFIAENAGVPASLVRSPDEVEEVKRQIMEATAAAGAAQAQAQQAA